MSTYILADKVEKASKKVQSKLEHNMSPTVRMEIFDKVSKQYKVDPDYLKDVMGYTKECKRKG